MRCSGKAFYSGRKAFEASSRVYIVGINPGGDPSTHGSETVGNHTASLLSSENRDWSAFEHEKWGSKTKPGSAPLQMRVKHLFCKTGMVLGAVPASNVIFKRSPNLSKLQGDFKDLADKCWPFHRGVIDHAWVYGSSFVSAKLPVVTCAKNCNAQSCKPMSSSNRK